MGRLDNKVAIITGSTSGIGRASAELFAKEGAKVVVGDMNLEGAQKIADQEFHGAFRLIFNTGIDAGQTVFHVHAHVLTGEKLDE